MLRQSLRGMRVAILAADGFEQVELTIPRKALLKRGAEVDIVSIRPGHIRGMNLLYPGKKMKVDRLVSNAHHTEYDALLLPGGAYNPDFLRQSPEALQFVRSFDHAHKPIAVICHGPWSLVSAGLVQGRRLTSWPAIKHDVMNAGGHWVDEACVRDRNWVSSQGPQDLPVFVKSMVSLFRDYAPVTAREGVHWGRWVAGGLALASVGLLAKRQLTATPYQRLKRSLGAESLFARA